jgi:hypothetical protein
MNISTFCRPVNVSSKRWSRFAAMLYAISLSGSMMAQVMNPDAVVLFDRNTVGGTAASAGSGGAYSSVGGDPSSMSLNPAGLGLFKTSDICISPGLRIANDQSAYNGSSLGSTHTIAQFGQAGAVFTKELPKKSGPGVSPFALKSFTFGINYQSDNTFDRDQNFNYLNTNHSLINNYATASNYYGTDQWSLESAFFSLAGIQGLTGTGGQYTSNVKAPVQQVGTISTRGGINNINLGFGGNLGDKIFFGFSLGVPLINYTVTSQISETNANANDTITHFQNYQLSSTVSESGVGLTGKVGLIFKPVSWFRVGVSYSLPTWYFLSENYTADLIYSFDSILPTEIGPYGADVFNYRIRTPMKGTIGTSFYLNENSFISADYEFQNIGATHYYIQNDSFQQAAGINSYLKSTYTYSHTLRVGLQGAIKKLRLRAGYSYTNSPFKSGQNYTTSPYNQAMQTATFGIGLRFKVFYVDLAYVFTYSKDGVSPNYVIPLDQINSTYMTHTAMLTLGFKIPTKGGNSSSSQPRRRSSDQLPKNIDPGDKY